VAGWPIDLLCSRNARPRKALVGRAQWEINRPPGPGNKSFRSFGGEEKESDGLVMLVLAHPVIKKVLAG
jgi:hypothetical protein